jgi:hypothetical protein
MSFAQRINLGSLPGPQSYIESSRPEAGAAKYSARAANACYRASSDQDHCSFTAPAPGQWPLDPEQLGNVTVFKVLSYAAQWSFVLAPATFLGT